MGKAERALEEARVLLAGKHTEGACNRAYCAMFDAAHAALWIAGAEGPGTIIKTHNGLLTAFGKNLVQEGLLDAELGRALSTVQSVRQIADHQGDPPAVADAVGALRLAEAFVADIRATFFGTP